MRATQEYPHNAQLADFVIRDLKVLRDTLRP